MKSSRMLGKGTMDKLKEIEERAKQATEGPWEPHEETEYQPGERPIGKLLYVTGLDRSIFDSEWADQSDWERSKYNADFIAHARSDIPYLLERLRDAEETLEKIRSNDRWSYTDHEGWGQHHANEYFDKYGDTE
jgi:hypothetical protein